MGRPLTIRKLEARRVLAVTATLGADNVLNIHAEDAGHTIHISTSGNDVNVGIDGGPLNADTFDADDVHRINVIGDGNDDTVTFDGLLSLVGVDGVSLHIDGMATATFAGQYNLAQDLVFNGGAISDLAGSALTVVGDTQLDAGPMGVVLDRGNHDFQGPVSIASDGDVSLHDDGDLTLHNLQVMGRLTAEADRILDTELGAVHVAKATNLTATDVLLDNQHHDFVGSVSVGNVAAQTTNDVALSDVNGIILHHVTAGGTLEINSGGNIVDSTTGIIDVEGETILTAVHVNLDNMQHDFVGHVDVTATKNVTLTDVNTLIVGEAAIGRNLSITAGERLLDHDAAVSVTGTTSLVADEVIWDNQLHDFQGVISAVVLGDLELSDVNDVRLFELAVGGQLIVHAVGNIDDHLTGKIEVEGATLLTAAKVNLENMQHDFEGAVSATVSGNLVLTDMNDILLHELTVGGMLEVRAVRNVADTPLGTIDVEGRTVLSAVNVHLDNMRHDFLGHVLVMATNNATLTDTNTLILREATIGGNLVVTAGERLLDRADGAIDVAGTTTLTAMEVVWDNSFHNFHGAISAQVAGDLVLTDVDDIRLFELMVGGQLIVQAVSNMDDHATGKIAVDGATLLTAANVDFDNLQHDFQGSVSTTVSGNLVLSDINNIRLHQLTVGGMLEVHALGNIADTQLGNIDVGGQTLLTAVHANLDNMQHDFAGAVSATTSGDLVLTDVNDVVLHQLTVGGMLNVHALGNIADTQQGKIDVEGRTLLTAVNVHLDNMLHDFLGHVFVTATTDATLTDINTLIVREATIGGNLSIIAGERLLDRDSGAIVVTGTTSLVADDAVWDNGSHDFQSVISAVVSGDLALSDINDVQLYQLAVGGQLIVHAAGNIDDHPMGKIDVTGATLLMAANVKLGNMQHDFHGAVSATTSGNLLLTDMNNIRLHQLTVGGMLDVHAVGNISDTQQGMIDVEGRTLLAAVNVHLDNMLHDFLGHTIVTTAADATLTDINTLIVQEATIGGNLSVRVGERLLDRDTGAILVAGTTSLVADEVIWDNGLHDFQGEVSAKVAGDLVLTDVNDVQLGELAVGGMLKTHAVGNIDDSPLEKIDVTGTTLLTAANVNLGNMLHDFHTAVSATVSGDVVLTDINDIRLHEIDVAKNISVATAAAVGSIRQTPAAKLTVGGSSAFVGKNVLLVLAENDFGGQVSVSAQEQARLTDRNDLLLAQVVVGLNFEVHATHGIFDVPDSHMDIGVNGTFVAGQQIRLANSASDTLVVNGNATFRSTSKDTLDVGQAAAAASIRFGTLSLDGGTARVYETDDTHFRNVTVNTLRASAENRFTQANRTSIHVSGSTAAIPTLFQLRSGAGEIFLARGSSDPDGSLLNNGIATANHFEGRVRIAGADLASAGLADSSNFHLRNVAPMAVFPEFAGPAGMPVKSTNFEIWFTNAKVHVPSIQLQIADHLRIVAGVEGPAQNPSVVHANATITDGVQTQIHAGQLLELIAASTITVADTELADSNDVNVMSSGRTRFHVVGSGNIHVGVTPFTGVNAVGRGDKAGVFETQSLFFAAGPENNLGHVTINTPGEALIIGEGNRARTLVLTALGGIRDTANSELTVQGPAGSPSFARLDAGGQQIILGRKNAVFRLPTHGVALENHFVSVSGSHVSLDVATAINLRSDTGSLSTPTIRFDVQDSLAIRAAGDILQVGIPGQGSLKAKNVGMVAKSVQLYDTTFSQFAAHASSHASVTQLADIPNRLPRDFAKTSLEGQELLPYDLNGLPTDTNPPPVDAPPTYGTDTDVISRRELSDEYGIVVVNQGSLKVTHVADATSWLGTVSGIASANGHVYIETQAGGNIEFDGMGTDAAPVTIVDVKNDSYITALAGGELIIAPHTLLTSATGTVVDVGDYETYDDRLTNNDAAKEGVRLVLIPPSTDANARTTRILIGPEHLQRVGLELGRPGESNLFIAIKWAKYFKEWSGMEDVFDIRRYQETIDPGSVDGIQVDMMTEFPREELLRSPFGPLFPTTIWAFNDPAINLYSTQADGSIHDLNVSILDSTFVPIPNELSVDTVDTNPFNPGNFVLASATIRPGGGPLPSVEPPPLQLYVPPPPDIWLPPAHALENSEFDDIRPVVVLKEELVEYGARENDQLVAPKKTWEKGLAGDYVSEIIAELENEDNQLWAAQGNYRIEIRLKNGLMRAINLIKNDNNEVRIETPADRAGDLNRPLEVHPAIDGFPGELEQGNPFEDSLPADGIELDQPVGLRSEGRQTARVDQEWMAAWREWLPEDERMDQMPPATDDSADHAFQVVSRHQAAAATSGR